MKIYKKSYLFSANKMKQKNYWEHRLGVWRKKQTTDITTTLTQLSHSRKEKKYSSIVRIYVVKYFLYEYV